jgi:hypothetical protein
VAAVEYRSLNRAARPAYQESLKALGVLEELEDVARGDEEVEALHHRALGGQRHERQHAEHGAVFADGGAATVAVGGRGVGLHEILPDRILLDARDRPIGNGRLDRGRLVEQLVGQHHTGETQNVDRVPQFGVAGGHRQRGIGAVRYAEEGQVAPRFLHGFAGGVEPEGGRKLFHLRGQLRAVGELDRELRLRVDLRGIERPGTGVAAQLIFHPGVLPAHESFRTERGVDAAEVDRAFLQLVRHPRRETMRGIDDVRVRDNPPTAVHEPPSPGFDEGTRLDGDGAGAAVERHFGIDTGGDERNAGLCPQDRFLDRERRCHAGRQQRRAQEHGDHPWRVHGRTPYHVVRARGMDRGRVAYAASGRAVASSLRSTAFSISRRFTSRRRRPISWVPRSPMRGSYASDNSCSAM